MQYFRFNTELQATDAQNQAYDDHIASLPTDKEVDDGEGGTIIIPIDNSDYIEGTTSWGSPARQRTTNTDFVFAICDHAIYRGWDIVEIDNNLEWHTEEEE